jgi:hypothetical protein
MDKRFLWALVAVAAFFLLSGNKGCVPVVTKPSPIAEKGFRVLIVENSDERGALPLPQLDLITSSDAGSIKAYVESRGGQFLPLDVDQKMDRMPEAWKQIWARPRTTVPWFQAYDPPYWFEGPLPKDRAEALSILAKVKK